jgi:hypothetical protein
MTIHRIGANLADEMASIHEVVELALLARDLADPSYKVSISDVQIICLHPLTNEGNIDEDYLVVYATGFEQCDVWIYKGEVDLPSTIERFQLTGVKHAAINELKKIYRMEIDRLYLS